MKYPNPPHHGRYAAPDHTLTAVEAVCRDSQDDLKNGHVEPMEGYIDTLRARLKDMRGN